MIPQTTDPIEIMQKEILKAKLDFDHFLGEYEAEHHIDTESLSVIKGRQKAQEEKLKPYEEIVSDPLATLEQKEVAYKCFMQGFRSFESIKESKPEYVAEIKQLVDAYASQVDSGYMLMETLTNLITDEDGFHHAGELKLFLQAVHTLLFDPQVARKFYHNNSWSSSEVHQNFCKLNAFFEALVCPVVDGALEQFFLCRYSGMYDYGDFEKLRKLYTKRIKLATIEAESETFHS